MRAEPTIEKSEARPGGLPGAFRDYIKDVRVEMAKVSWPTRDELRRHTLVVIIMVAVFAVFTGLVDWLLSRGFELMLKVLG